jgi:RHS repeat-associated protein
VAKTCYDAAGRITGVTNDGTAAPYASGITYTPHGAADKLTLGNGLHEATNFNNRLQPTLISLGTTAGATDKLKIEFGYGGTSNNGNILTQTITPPGLTALTQDYTYDEVNRILTASEAAGANWSRTYDYDPYGNRAVIGNTGLPVSPLMPGALTEYVAATNRFVTGSGAFDNAYDAAGNHLRNKLGELLAYDANNHQTSYFDPISAVTTTYAYDGQGNRVKKLTPSKTDIYVYDAFGKLAAEYSTVAPADPGTHYRTVDHLGSTRLVTDAAGTEIERRDYLPFGEEIPSTVGNRGPGSTATLDDRHRFTSKERDAESQLDYFLARYYSGPMGRFLSVDPFSIVLEAQAADDDISSYASQPQHWNKYAYVLNNPLRLIDPLGLLEFDVQLLGETVNVNIDDTLPEKKQQQQGKKVRAGLAAIEDNKAKLTAGEQDTIKNIVGVKVDKSIKRAFVSDEGVLNLTPEYVDNSSNAFLGSAVAHDGYHRKLAKEGRPDRDVKAEQESIEFQIQVGKKTGLSGGEVKYLETTKTNTGYLRKRLASPVK